MNQTLNQVLLTALDDYAERPSFQIKEGRHYQPISYHSFGNLTFRMTELLHNRGITGNERLAIAADTCLEWMGLYMACLLCGGTTVPLRTSLPLDTLHHILQESGARIVLLQNSQTAWSLLDRSPLPDLNTILVMEESEDLPPQAISIRAGLAQVEDLSAERRAAIRGQAEAVSPEALACLCYLTGYSGHPKGAMFDQGQSCATLRHMARWLQFKEDDLGLTVGSWSEAPNLLFSLHYFVSGVSNVLADPSETINDIMQQTSPTLMLTIPYALERFYQAAVTDQPESDRKVMQWALAKGKEYRAAGPNASPDLRQAYLRADMTFFSQLRREVGGRLNRMYSTGASLSEELVDFFETIGLPIYNLYTLTEAGGFPAVNRPSAYRPDSCGQVAPGFEIRLSDESEILVRGESVMRGYWPDMAQESVDADGWLHSGDVGYMDEDGYLFVTGRTQHLLVLSTGRKIVPPPIETALTQSPFIAQAAIFGDGKPYVSAMIVPNLPALAAYFRDEAEPVNTTGHPRVKELLNDIIRQVNEKLDKWEQIREFSLLDQPLTRDAGELTPSLKISRHVVAERYAAQIESMYPPVLQLDASEVTQVKVEPERLRSLLEKESILDAWLSDAGIEFLFELAREKQIDAPSMVHICDAAAIIAQMENEEKPLSTALIVGDPTQIGHILPPSQIQLRHHEHIRRMGQILVAMSKMVDGLVLGYVIDKYGFVRGIHKLEVEIEEPENFLLGPQFRRHAAISQYCNAVVFFVPTGGRQVRVFANGQLVGRYAHGDWSPDKVGQVDRVLGRLEEEGQHDIQLVKRLLRCAFQMSEENLGAIFLLGNANLILKHSDSSEISSLAAIFSAKMDSLSDQELINFAKQDGATVIEQDGRFRGCMVLLRPAADTVAEIGPGKGARHSSAAKMSAEANCLAITVSQDGPITMYARGKRILSL